MTKIIRGLQNLPDNWSDCAVTIGKFDGLHLGHQLVLEELRKLAGDMPTVMLSFHPNPLKFFNPDNEYQAVLNFRDTLHWLSVYQVDYLLLLPFNQKMRELSAEDFLRLLQQKVKVKKIIVGEDFRFGYKRAGDIDLLKQFAGEHDIEVVTPKLLVSEDDAVIGSSMIRDLLQQGQLQAVAQLLGRPYAISGKVIKGDQVGRQLGFPTANINLKDMRPALRGVFAVKVFKGEQFVADGVANLGVRPTVSGLKLLLEVHLFVDDIDCYGECLTVEFVEKIRDEQKFDSLDELKQQIGRDVVEGKRLLAEE